MRGAIWSAWPSSWLACSRNSAAAAAGVDAVGHEVVALVAEVADELGGQRLVEHLDDPIAVGAVRGGDRALLDLRPCSLTEGLHVGEEVAHAGKLRPTAHWNRLATRENRWPDGETTRRSPSSAPSSTRTGGSRRRSSTRPSGDTVVVAKDGEERTFSSDHIAFHRFVEGLKEDFAL